MAEGTRMQQRRATDAVWNTSSYVLAPGELGIGIDTGVIKIGDGINVWSALDLAFDSQYLPILGKAADSDLLDGIEASGFVQVGDIPDFRTMVIGRSVSGNFTLAATDISTTIIATNSAWTPNIVATIPANATVSMAIGSVIDIISTGIGAVKLTPAGGVTLNGSGVCYGGYGTIRIAKIATDTWITLDQRMNQIPHLKRFMDDITLDDGVATMMTYGGSEPAAGLRSGIVDSLGTNAQYSSGASDRFICRREGWYDINIQFGLGLNSGFDTDSIETDLMINGVVQHTPERFVMVPAAYITFYAQIKLPLQLSDYLQLRVEQNSGFDQFTMNSSICSPYIQWQWTAPL